VTFFDQERDAAQPGDGRLGTAQRGDDGTTARAGEGRVGAARRGGDGTTPPEPPERGDHPYGWEDDLGRYTYRPARRRILPVLVSVAFLALVAVALVVGAYRWFQHRLDPPGEPGEAITVIVPSGATTADIGRLLEEAGVIPSGLFFRYYAQWRGAGNFQAGEYLVPTNSSAQEAIDVMVRGPIPPVVKRFTVPEGLWISEALPRIAAQTGVTVEQLQAALDSGQVEARYRPEGIDTYEGLLFPDTYEVREGASAVQILNRMAEEFARVTGELGFGAVEQRLGVSAYEAVIIASLIEAEARTDGDRPKIARVIYNRLLRGEPLGIDATYIYAHGERGRPITTEDIQTDSPWNLRTRAGLPPHPIALPGRASLAAAVNPEDGPWLWYVLADEAGNHFFTDDYDEFLRVRDESRARGLF
jgi:UPF0755 protein